MTKRYDWSKLPEGIGAGAKGRICEYISDGRYNYFPHNEHGERLGRDPKERLVEEVK